MDERIAEYYESKKNAIPRKPLLSKGQILYCKNGEKVQISDFNRTEIYILYKGKIYCRKLIEVYNITLFPEPYEKSKVYYNLLGYDSDGYDKFGYNAYGYDRQKFSIYGIHQETGTRYDPEGYSQNGFDSDGYNKKGFSVEGINKLTGTKYDSEGYDINGLDRYGYDRDGQIHKIPTKHEKWISPNLNNEEIYFNPNNRD